MLYNSTHIFNTSFYVSVFGVIPELWSRVYLPGLLPASQGLSIVSRSHTTESSSLCTKVNHFNLALINSQRPSRIGLLKAFSFSLFVIE